ncbi:MAG: sigma-70 family RNA polymerase sigma factor [Phycisphaerales bacterium]|nr:sigma-70 family RNA polymerase sigma factor [Phycisphaerales bacterium]
MALTAGPPQNVTILLEAASRGDRQATDDLLPVVYEDLRRLAGALLAREPLRGSNTLQPTALVHEAYMRLVGPGDVSWENRRHFFGAAAQAMRRLLIDRARHIRATGLPLAPGADPADAAEPGTADLPGRPDDLIALDQALESLRDRDERQFEVVMLRYFAGLTIEQTASAQGVSPGTVKGDWTYARAWLLREVARHRASNVQT